MLHVFVMSRRYAVTLLACAALFACSDSPGEGQGIEPDATETDTTPNADVTEDVVESDITDEPDVVGRDVSFDTGGEDATSDTSTNDADDDTFFNPDVVDDDVPPTSEELGLLAIDPARGPSAGDTRVFIFGYGFTVETEVLINGRLVRDIDLVDSETIIAITPTNPAGSYDVKVVTDARQATLPLGFTYFDDLDIDAVEPVTGPERGGVPLVVTGEGFTPSTQVSVGGRLGIDIRIINEETIEFVSPPGSEGEADVRVTNENGTVVLQAAYTFYAEPEILSIEPAAGPTTGDVAVEISARGLTESNTITIGPAAAQVTALPNGNLRVRVPAGAPGFADVSLANELGGDTIVDGFYYVADPFGPPAIDAVVPARGAASGGYLVTIAGPGMDSATAVRFGAETALIERTYDGAVLVRAPVGADVVDVEVDIAAVTIVGQDAFTYVPDLTVDSVDPPTGESSGGETVRLIGAGFTNDLEVRFGPARASNVTLISDTELEVVTPPGSVGAVDVVLRDSERTGVAEGAFTYLDDAEVYSIAPTRGAIAGNTLVVIRGRGFYGDVQVFFGEEEAPMVSIVDAATLEVRTPRMMEPDTVSVRVLLGDVELEVRDRFVFYDPFSPAGGWWGEEINGSVNVTVIDSGSGEPLEGAFVTTSLRATATTGTPYFGSTNDVGQVTLSGSDLAGIQTVSASARGYGSATITDVNAENIVIFIAEAVAPPPGTPSGDPPPTISGTLSGLDKIVNPAEGQSIVGIIRTTTPGVGASNPQGTGFAQVTWTGGDAAIPFEMASRFGELAVVAVCGLLTEATGEFEPLFMGMQRGFAVRSAGEELESILDCDIPLDLTMTFKFVNPPLSPGGLTTLSARPELDFGNEGATDLLNVAEGRSDEIQRAGFVSLDNPQLAGIDYEVTAQATTGGGGLPFAVVYARDVINPEERLILGPFIPPADLEYPAPGGTLVDRRFEWSVATEERPDFYYAYIQNNAQDITYWEVWLPGDQTGFNLPFFPPGSDVGPLPVGEQLVLIVLSIKAYSFDYDNWQFNDFGSNNWRAYSAGGWGFINPGN
ncbi:MAG: hypothetical protein ACI81R_000234 [Bradymonadia bacterium]|jgi:hypothetical protein